MKNNEILNKASAKKALIGEAEQKGLQKCYWLSLLIIGMVAVAFMIIEGIFAHFTTIYVLASICFLWGAVFYFLQYFIAKRKHVGILIGAILESLAFVFFVTRYILAIVGIWW